MNGPNQKARSRPLGVATNLLQSAINAESVLRREVLLIGEASTLSMPNGRNCFVDAFLLLTRFVGKLTLAIPDDMPELFSEMEKYRARSYFAASVVVMKEGQLSNMDSFSAILNVGSRVNPKLRWTSVNSHGWVARVSSGSTELPSNCKQDNAMGALMAASIGATEVFKRIFSIPSHIAPMVDFCELSLFEMTTQSNNPGPDLPKKLDFSNFVLVGGGAIGNGIALLASQLPIIGRLHIIDKQDYAEENFGTCVLMETDGWLGVPKAERLAAFLNEQNRIEARGTRDLIENVLSKNSADEFDTELVLTALDDVDARREAQRLWPPVIVDGGISEVGAAVVQSRLTHPNIACLQCWFEKPLIDERIQQSKWTGLDIERLGNMERLLTDDDISSASIEKREWLKQCKTAGKNLCSIITEAQLKDRLGIEVEEGFRPSVPFVATAAAALVMSEAIKALQFPDAPFGSLFQLANLFIGPDALIVANRDQSPTCACVTHRPAVTRLQAKRSKMHNEAKYGPRNAKCP